MRIEVLSDHVGDLLRAAEKAVAVGGDTLDQLRSEYRAAESEVLEAAAAKSWWRRLLVIESAREAVAARRLEELRRQFRSALRRGDGDASEMERLRAGYLAEQSVVDALAERFADDWTCFRGYANARGEADVLLVGPRGIWVVEIKYRRVHLTVNGHHWTYQKFDRHGNLRQAGPAVDGGGRTWARQASDVADALTQRLHAKTLWPPVRTAVANVHDEARLVSIRNLGVDCLVTYSSDLIRNILHHPASLDADQRHAIEEVIRRDHHDHAHRSSLPASRDVDVTSPAPT